MSTDDATLRREVYGFADLRRYPFRKRIVIRLAGVLFWLLIMMIGCTLRWSAVEVEPVEECTRTNRRFVGAFWHNRVFLATWFFRDRGIVVMTSQSFDGEYIARFIQRFGYGAARGSARRGARQATLQMVACLRAGMDTAFSIDGPTGPRYVAKPGAVRLAAMTGAAVIPVSASAERYWQVNNWDRFQIPKPFSRVVVLAADPIYVDPSGGDEAIARAQEALQAALDGLRARGDAWWAAPKTVVDARTTARV